MSDRITALLTRRRATLLVVAVVLCLPPFYLDAFWLRIGLFSMAAAIGAIGLALLSGTAGQLSLGHAFFLAVGAYGYTWLAGDPGPGLPTALAVPLAVLMAGLAGGLFSPVAGRVKGIYLGIATLALVFLGHHVLLTAESVTGGFNGRSVPPLSVGGFTFDADGELNVLGVPFGAEERLWFLGLALFALTWFTARGLLRSRPGRALAALRDSETAAAVMGVDVARHRSAAFVVSSMYAGLAGVLLALAFRRVVPDYFGLVLSVDYLAMIVIGGLGSVAGATAGAVFVTALPLLMTRYADQLPLVAAPGSTEGAVGPTEAARYLYGAAIVLVLLYAPDGLHGLVRRARDRLRRRRTPTTAPHTAVPSPPPPAAAARPKEHTP
ncbi:branched-chain amino acid ABC transporter permease [Streptomyces cellulosae]|uniref:Branched-chain amino acid transport system permease protein n=1 Tax=Streptomyces thermodiastaticus TaxID=44061 RepID=A0ABU0KPR0_9ACTN|nr:branched-chain amino acid ABC transporter permease [Streptomyces sp. McG7]MCX4480646.1 branched-chain amino acid ABC transporter permease [Streptomyces cellulosae]MDQ0491431.1 branched-chain amino acid transport system permease protein [Streptomyces thermodiastaticus]MDX3413537.1 branched-chain amino acid ABC transporter permease [Streptomyces sp. MD20-1-1]MXQ61210.1 branched-chain amino acid ABC transporter permease [Streptomyces sp. XHT-2]THC58789.1 branched-chain amino acid ABC transport